MGNVFQKDGAGERVILHCDLNCFFASVELLERPDLRDKYVAVGGDKEARHGIILAKNENAKRLGVKTGETLWEARKKCPELIVLSPHFEKYMHYSKLVRNIYLRYTDLVESFGADECWLDVTGSQFIFGTGFEIAENIRKTVKSETGLTISVGVSFNKIFAKLGSDMKKPDAVTEITKANFKSKVWPLPCDCLFGVGRSTGAYLKRHGIYTIGDLASADALFMKKIFGKCGGTVLQYARGEDDVPVSHQDYVPDVKSISHGCTSAFDILNYDTAELLIISLSESIAEKLRRLNFAAYAVSLQIKTNKLESNIFSKSVTVPIQSAKQIAEIGGEIIKENCDFSEPIRAISIAVTNLKSADEPFQYDLYTDYDRLKKTVVAEHTADIIRKQFGAKSIFRASLMNTDFSRNCAIYEFSPFQNNSMRR